MYKILGIINAALIIVITSPYWLRRLGQRFFLKKGSAFTGLIKGLRAVHKPLGVLSAVGCVDTRGCLALVTPRLHTGTLVGVDVLITVMLGILFYKKKKSYIF